MTLRATNQRVLDLEQHITNDSAVRTKQTWDGLQWTFRGKQLKDLESKIGGERFPCNTVFHISLDKLHYNFSNRRVSIYLKERQIAKLESPQDFQHSDVSENNPEDITWMQRLLLGKETIYGVASNVQGFTEELIAHGQQEPAIITIDGTLRNGNRRKAIFHDLLEKIASGHKDYLKLDKHDFDRLKVIILPRDINEEELFDLENVLQTKKDWKQPYDPISILHIIKEAHDKYGFDFDEIRKRYLHDMTAKTIENDYQKIAKMDEYLEFRETPEQYGQIKGQQELFQDHVNYDFEEVGLSDIHRENAKLKQEIGRKRKQLFFDIVSANACNSEVLRPTDKAVRKLVMEIFKKHTDDPLATIQEFYEGIDAEKLRKCEDSQVEKFGTRIESQIQSYAQRNLQQMPLEKLRKIIKDLRSFRTQDYKNMAARAKESNKQIKNLTDVVEELQKGYSEALKKG